MVLLEAFRVFARSWFACRHSTAAPACGSDEEDVFELHAEAISNIAGSTTVTNGRRNSLDLSRSVRVCALMEASLVIDGSRMSMDAASCGVRGLSSGPGAHSGAGPPEGVSPRG